MATKKGSEKGGSKKPRTAAQKAATRKMLAANKARKSEAKKPRKKGTAKKSSGGGAATLASLKRDIGETNEALTMVAKKVGQHERRLGGLEESRDHMFAFMSRLGGGPGRAVPVTFPKAG